MAAARNWCFTLNNYTDEELKIVNDLGDKPTTRYMIYGKEVGEKGTPHLQGYIQLNKKIRLTGVKKLIDDKVHWEPSRGSVDDNKKYCSKEGQFVEFGEAVHQGQRTDVKECIKRRLEGEPWIDLIDNGNAIHYKRAIDEIVEEEQLNRKKIKLMDSYNGILWKPWQLDLIRLVDTEPDKRTINWYWEDIGNTGKTFVGKYIGLSGFYTDSGKVVDIKHAYNGERVFVLNLARTNEDFVPYGLLECVKDGCYFSGKYNSQVKYFKSPHVIVFANYPPLESKMSADRWNIININEQLKIVNDIMI